MHLFDRYGDHDYQFELLIRGAGCPGVDKAKAHDLERETEDRWPARRGTEVISAQYDREVVKSPYQPTNPRYVLERCYLRQFRHQEFSPT